MKDKRNIGNLRNREDITKSGEFISSFFSWNTLEGQKEKVRELENIAKPKKEKTVEKKKNKD